MQANVSTMLLVLVGVAVGCAAQEDLAREAELAARLGALTLDGAELNEARRLFDEETFGGNGRTCRTCHSASNGTLTMEQIAALHAEDSSGPLFRGDGTDDGQGNGTSRILADGTLLVQIPLPPHTRLADEPFATHVTLRRGISSTLNTPALDPVLMWDGRAPDLIEQARSAILGHAQAEIPPTQTQLKLIADFQKTDTFFSSPELLSFAAGGPPPALPEGNTESERRGRRFFDDVEIAPPSTRGTCALCHSGPLLNESNGRNPLPVPPYRVPKGTRFQSILSAELKPGSAPLRTFIVTRPGSAPEIIATTDPGRALITGDFRGFPYGDLGKFKIPVLRGVKDTAPYFHNNAAKTLEDVVEHYARFFIIATPIAMPGAPPIVLTEQDKADLVAFLRLL